LICNQEVLGSIPGAGLEEIVSYRPHGSESGRRG
jgi:hypothetical protein